MPPLAAETPQPGDSASTSTDDRLLAFLRQKLAGEALPLAAAAHFHDADIYAADPATLTSRFDSAPAKKSGDGGSWFFFTYVKPKSPKDNRKSRMVGGGAGTWHSERAARAVLDDEGSCIGHTQYFCYKRKTGKNCYERTDWYMLEFTEGQEGDLERVHGGEPMLVLCKIYRAHSGSRSSARKRKPTDAHLHVDQSSAPVKVKRRLFAPASTSAGASQEQVSSRVTTTGSQDEVAKSELEVSNGNIGGTSYDPRLCAELVAAVNKAPLNKTITATPMLNQTSTATPSHDKISTTSPSLVMSESDFLRFWPEPKASQKIDGTSDYLEFLSEMEELQQIIATAMLEAEVSTLQGVPGMFDCRTEALPKIHSTPDYLKFSSETEALHKTSRTPSSVSLFKPEVSALQGKTTTFDWGTEASQMVNAMSDYLKLSSETEALQKASVTPPSLSMFEPEVSALQGETTTFDWGTKASQKIDDASDCLKFSSESEALQKISTTPPSVSMFEPETSALQDVTPRFDWGTQMPAGCTRPVSAHCYGMTDRDRACFFGGLPTCDVWGY